MNERIKELAFEAMSINQKVSDDSFFVEVSKLKEFEKFAELIVKEFSKQVQIEGRFGLEREQTLIRLCCENAKKHFGVEE